MATFTPSSIIGQISGPIGGIEFSRGRSGNVIKLRRRRRPPQSPNQEQWSWVLAKFAEIWRAASPGLRKSWATYAATQTTVNRWAQSVPAKPYVTALKHHIFIYQFLDGVFPDPAYLQPPPASLPKPAAIYFLSGTFTDAPSYCTDCRINDANPHREFLWAGPAKNQTWSGRVNWQFIGSQDKTAFVTDWTAQIQSARVNWTFPQGQVVFVKVAHARSDAITGFNTPWFRPLGVTHV
jgi:hypothetical protein